DVEREVSHGVGDVEFRAVLPPFGHSPRLLDHRPGVAAHTAGVEGRLHQPPLPQPEVALAEHQALAVHGAERAHEPFDLAEALAPGDEDVAYRVRPVDEVDVLAEDAGVGDVPVGPGQLQEVRQRVAADARGDAEAGEPAGGTGRVTIHWFPSG